jgi:hypothetical protein
MKLRSPTTITESPDQQYKHGADDSSNKPGILVRAIPADGLPEVRRDECADNAEDRGEYEALGRIVARCDELSNDARNQADKDSPEDVHLNSSALRLAKSWRAKRSPDLNTDRDLRAHAM